MFPNKDQERLLSDIENYGRTAVEFAIFSAVAAPYGALFDKGASAVLGRTMDNSLVRPAVGMNRTGASFVAADRTINFDRNQSAEDMWHSYLLGLAMHAGGEAYTAGAKRGLGLTSKNMRSNESVSWSNDAEHLRDFAKRFLDIELGEIKTDEKLTVDGMTEAGSNTVTIRQNPFGEGKNGKVERLKVLYHEAAHATGDPNA